MGIRRPWQAVDYDEIVRNYPPPPEYFQSAWFAGPDEIERTQLARLRQRALSAGRVPFFAEMWEAAGFDPRSITSLDDL
jgi:phenylacetate-CoA ligase